MARRFALRVGVRWVCDRALPLRFQYSRLDLGDMVQAIWTTAHGHFFQTTNASGHQISRLGVHTDVFLVLLVPLWLLWSSPMMLVVLQAAAVSAGALPVFWLARKHLESQAAALFLALAYLVFPATQFNAFAPATGFHSVSIAIPLLLFAILFLDEDRLIAFAVVGVLAATHEGGNPTRRRSARHLVCDQKRALADWLGDPCAGPFDHPLQFLRRAPTFQRGGLYLWRPLRGFWRDSGRHPSAVWVHSSDRPHRRCCAGGPQARLSPSCYSGPFSSLLAARAAHLLCAAPDLVINLLSNQSAQTSIMFHYTAGIIPFVVAGSIFGLARAKGQHRRLSLYVLTAVTGLTVFFSPLLNEHLARASPSNPVHRAKALRCHRSCRRVRRRLILEPARRLSLESTRNHDLPCRP